MIRHFRATSPGGGETINHPNFGNRGGVNRMDCMGCLFWRRRGAANGECHRFPPTPVITEATEARLRGEDDRGEIGVWPITRPSDDCGEWRRIAG